MQMNEVRACCGSLRLIEVFRFSEIAPPTPHNLTELKLAWGVVVGAKFDPAQWQSVTDRSYLNSFGTQ